MSNGLAATIHKPLARIRRVHMCRMTWRFGYFPESHCPRTENPRVKFRMCAISHGHETESNMIWYNNALTGGTRNETRITGLGGAASPLLDPENTGAVAIFFFAKDEGSRECQYWVCRDSQEEDVAEDFAGPSEPGRTLFWGTAGETLEEHMSCWIRADQIPNEWIQQFPTPQEVLDKALAMQPYKQFAPDERLIRRRECEYAVFRSVEHAVESGWIGRGFESIEAFLAKAQKVLQRRKARSGRSLELQLRVLLQEEGVRCSFQPTTEGGKRPDFVFPSQEAYEDEEYPAGQLRMLAAKTTVKERWRQVLSEADRIPLKHLVTLQEGVSEGQFAQMSQAGVRLVVPKRLHARYPQSIRSGLMTLEGFVDEARALSG